MVIIINNQIFYLFYFGRCDKCSKHYHFCCIDPPVKKTPKVVGYLWHCKECDLSVNYFLNILLVISNIFEFCL